MYNRPDRPLVVKCSYDSWNKKITFSSARNCTYDVLKRKVEQCFSLHATPFVVAYKDDDGEITTISTDTDLTEAIQYFQAGDDASLSSAASILSGRSFGGRRVTLRVHISVEYDGPSLSDTSSLVSLEEYRGRNASQQSFSFNSGSSLDLDDDSVTVSSRDNSAASARSSRPLNRATALNGSERFSVISGPTSDPTNTKTQDSRSPLPSGSGSSTLLPASLSSPGDHVNLDARDPSNVFERLKLQETMSDGWSSADYDTLERNDRGAAWLRDQNERAIRSRLGALPEPSVSDQISLPAGDQEGLGGALELEQDPYGRYYYTYTSAYNSGGPASQAQDEDVFAEPTNSHPPRPTSMHLNWLASQQISSQSEPKPHTEPSDEVKSFNSGDSALHLIDKEFLPFIDTPAPVPDKLTGCSECGTLLDSFRYVCTICGEKSPIGSTDSVRGKGKAPDHTHYSPPSPHRYPPSSSPATSYLGGSSITLGRRPVPPIPTAPKGYELCSNCLQSAGVNHAISAGSPLGIPSPTSPEDSSQWRRAAPKKGQLRHAYHEKVWGHTGWEDVEQDEAQVSKCSTCETTTARRRYKCASCPNINLCLACYSQVHELHPSHAFLTVPDKCVRFQDPVVASADASEEQPLKHPGVKCAHCLLDIVGARFHCAICDSIDICANCESAGLPGNLDSADGGHISSHILIKIPYPLETNELETASRWAIHLWTRDAANVGLPVPRSKAGSVVSSYARTVVGSRAREPQNSLDHLTFCNGCSQPIIGIRYQCAYCPSPARAYNLCQNCEPRSYLLHDPMHMFFKFRRPVQQQLKFSSPLIPILYTSGPEPNPDVADPKAYLLSLTHKSAVCDRCIKRVEGEWFRCAYCARDLCDACEEVDTHDDTHVFMVFKAEVDMDLFKIFAELSHNDNDDDTRPKPVIPYPVYH